MKSSVDLLAQAVEDAAPNYLEVRSSDLGLATPCEDWDLRALLNHVCSRFVISTNAANKISTPSFEPVEIDYIGDDPAGVFSEMSNEMVEAWRACTDMGAECMTPLGAIPAEMVVLFGAQDVFVHAWDVAAARGVEPKLSTALVEVFTKTHKESVDEQTRKMFFAPEIEVDDDVEPLEKLVAFLGRRPRGMTSNSSS